MTTPGNDNPTPQTENQPPYADYLNQFPETVRDQAEEVFKKWDADVNKRFEGIHSQYKPWEDVISNYDPQSVGQALGLADAMQENPQAVWEQMAQVYGFAQNLPQQVASGGGVPESGQGPSDPDMDLPPQFVEEFGSMKKMVELLGQAYLQQNQQAEEQRQMQEFDAHLTKLEKEMGPYDRQWVLSKIAGGVAPEQAISEYKEFEQSVIQRHNQRSAPTIAPGGGGLPSTMPDTSRMPAQDVKNLVAQYLMAANQQNG